MLNGIRFWAWIITNRVSPTAQLDVMHFGGGFWILSHCSLEVSSAPQPLLSWDAIPLQKALEGLDPLPRSDGAGGFGLGPLADQLTSQLKKLCKSWRHRRADARLLVWREISFFVLVQISPCSLQKSSVNGDISQARAFPERPHQQNAAMDLFQKLHLHTDYPQRRCLVTRTPRVSGGGQI